MLRSIPEGIKEIAYSLTHLCYNMLGHLPAPILYGIVCDYTGGEKSRFGIIFLMLFSLLGVYFLYNATCESKSAKKEINEINELFIKQEKNNINTYLNESENERNPIKKRESSIEALSAIFGRPSMATWSKGSLT